MELKRLWAVRTCGIVLLTVLLYQVWRLAEISLLADSVQAADLDRAIAMQPDNAAYHLRRALRNQYNESLAPGSVEKEFREVVARNPRSAEALMKLGLLAEERGENQTAETLLEQAVSLDKTFKPAWTLANFYFRASQRDASMLRKMWPQIHAALDTATQPGLQYFDVGIVYDLCWQSGADSKQILEVIPNNAVALVGYFNYLVQHKQLPAAVEAFPRVLPYTDPSDQMHRDRCADFCNLLFEDGQIGAAVEAWNRLVGKGMIESTRVEPDSAPVANPAFLLPLGPQPFGWFKPAQEGISSYRAQGEVTFEFTGQQREAVVVLEKRLPLLSGRDYRLTWKAQPGNSLKPAGPAETGLNILFYEKEQQLPATCPPLLTREKQPECLLHVPGSGDALRPVTMKIIYLRPQGSVRLRGDVKLNGVHLTTR